MSKRTVELELATPGVDAQGNATRVPLATVEEPVPRDVNDLLAVARHGLPQSAWDHAERNW